MSRILVVDASVVVDLIGRFRPEPIESLLWADDTVLAAPELVTIEALQALRRLDQAGAIPPGRRPTIELLQAMAVRTYRHAELLAGMWALRENLTVYDAAYVVLARLLGATLLTRDEKLAGAPGLGVRVEIP